MKQEVEELLATIDHFQTGMASVGYTATSGILARAATLLRTQQERIEELEKEWQPIETAPYEKVVEVKVGSMTLEAILIPGASVNECGNSCDQWQAAHEGEHPPCWSGGACWESNEDEQMSLQPHGWRSLRPNGNSD